MIRTYTRKPPECRYIEGVLGLCRLCLQRAEEAVPIFTEDRTDICSSLALRIMICVGLELKREDTLPNHICLACYKDLELYYAFRKKCEVSYQKLKSHIQAIQNRQAAEALSSATEVAVKQIDAASQDQDDNVNVDELELMMGSEESYGVLEIEAAPAINDVPTDILPVATMDTKAKQEPLSMDPAELPSMIAAVLVKLGLLSRADGLLARRGPARLQLETADGAVVRMEVVEEDDESETGAEKEQDGSYRDVPNKEPEFCDAPAKQNDIVVKTSADSRGKTKVNDVDSKKTRRRALSSLGAGAGVECSRCGRVLASLAALRRHTRTHSGERPFACARCGRRFAQKEVMRRHALVHEEVRPHRCSQCPKSFTQRNALALHERSHLPPLERALPLHRCPHCPKLFLYSSGLSRHMMTHAGRLYECGACHKQFADKSSVLRHVRRAKHTPRAAADFSIEHRQQ